MSEQKLSQSSLSATSNACTGHDHPTMEWGAYVMDGRASVAKVWGATHDEALARAQMFAAAPDLYEALEAVVAIADRKTVEFDRARAALAKARGEQQP